MAANNGWDQEHVHDVASDYMSVEGSNSHTSPRRFTNPQSYRPRGDFRGKDNWRSRGQNMRSRPYQNRGPPQHQGQFRGGDFRNRPPQNNFWNQRGGPSRGGHFEPRQQNQSFRPQHSFSPRGRFDRGRSGGRGNFRVSFGSCLFHTPCPSQVAFSYTLFFSSLDFLYNFIQI